MKQLILLSIFVLTSCLVLPLCKADNSPNNMTPTTDNNSWFYLKSGDLIRKRYHTRHEEIFGKYVAGYNHFVLKGIDKVQKSAPDGGGYFIGIKADPPESPLGYPLRLFGLPILNPPRKTSYCSGSTYGALIEALNMIFSDGGKKLSLDRFEAMRMQEPDGGRREDGIKFWGHWNADGFGSQYALVQYAGMGTEIPPQRARPGDFMNISWRRGGGHSVIFLGWIKNNKKKPPGIAYWASQAESNGLADVYSDSTNNIKYVKTVRLTNPENIFNFKIENKVEMNIRGDVLKFK